MPTNAIDTKIDSTGVDPKEVAAIEQSIAGKREQAPTVREQSGNVDWKAVRDALGQPFDIERIPLRKLKQMRKDAMIAFALHYRKTPLVRAQWHVDARDKDGPNAQVAGFFDAAWRLIHARYIFQHTNDFDFGYSAIVKTFMQGNPGGVYYDPQEQNPENALKPVWDEGNVDPYIWKPFVALPPERVTPNFDNDGNFAGIIYEPPPAAAGGRGTGFKSKQRRGSGNANEREIDLYHSLWATNGKDAEFGNIFGYPLIGHSYRFWWSYWFLWANLDRAFERMAIPPMVAYHPEGSYVDPETREELSYQEIALNAAESLRSNAIAAVPSTLATAGLEEKGTQLREWEFRFLETPQANFDQIGKHLSYLDVMKLRACWVPEQAFIEGEGGTSSRNVAAQMAEIFLESQANKWEEIADHVNRYIFPQLAAVNFPEFVNNGGRVRIVGHGFAKEDVEFLKQIIQLVGQADPASLGVDIREALSRIGAPLKTPEQIVAEQNRLAAQGAAGGPPLVEPRRGQVGTVPNPGFTNGGSVPEPNSPGASVTGFADQPYIYINPNPVIELSDHDDFLAALPQSSHYKDKTMRALAVQLRKLWQGALREMYPDFAKFVAKQPALELSDDLLGIDDDTLDEGFELEFGIEQFVLPDADVSVLELAQGRNRRKATRLANKLLREWGSQSVRLARLAEQSKKILEKMVVRSAKLVAKMKGLDYQAVAEDYEDYLNTQIGRLIKSVHGTTKKNLRTHLVNEIMDGKSAAEIGDSIRDHFEEFPDWRADRIARSETRDAYNAATLIVSEAAGVKYVRAKDAQLGPTDAHCEQRNGKLFTVKEAWKQMGPTLTHPYDTLEFEPIARATFSVQPVTELPEGAPEGADAWYDKSSDTAYVPFSLSDEDADEFLSAVAEHVLEEV